MSIRFASIGTGWIAGEFLKGAREVEGLEYTACYSRSQEKGEEFAKQWGAQKVYTDLEAMAEDKEIDAVYIASPNALHYSQSKLFLQHGKHVICEKPITVEPEQGSADWGLSAGDANTAGRSGTSGRCSFGKTGFFAVFFQVSGISCRRSAKHL